MPRLRVIAVTTCVALASCTPGISTGNQALDYDLPEGWHIAETSLTPKLTGPHEILSAGTFPLLPGGDNCAQIPQAAMEALGTEDVLISLQEQSTDDQISLATRPSSFGPLLTGINEGDAFECIEPRERDDVGVLLWLPFHEQGRAFYLIVVMGTQVSDEVRQQTVELLDGLNFRA